jgi:uncharacterized protein YkwD/outer membrane protein OmpA-like peptidoglycan-associated protein
MQKLSVSLIKVWSLLFLLMLASLSLPAQKNNKNKNSDENFKIDSLPTILLRELNRFRTEKGLGKLEFSDMLIDAAYLSADDMASSGKDKVEDKKSKKYLKKSGATPRGEQVTMKAPVSKGRENYKTADVAKVIYDRWENNQKNLLVLNNPKFTLIGIACQLNEDGKKVFVSAFFGGYDITNGGAPYRKELKVPYNKASKGLKDFDAKKCKNCDRWRNYDVLHKGIVVAEDGKIYLEYKNARELRRLLKKAKDGIAVDVVQRDQYVKADYNIVDNNLNNKGVMGKVMYRDKFFKSNLLTKDVAKNKKNRIKGIKVEMGKLPKKLSGAYEVNIIVVQDGKYCKTITRGYNESGNIDSNTPIGIMAVKGTTGIKPPFEPRNESSILTFNIPFEKNKFEFKNEDIQPLIKALNEPDFIIDGLYIYAYSSIEGDSAANAKLQRKRAESVTNVLQSMQKTKIKPSIETKDSWGLFMLENEDGKYAYLVNMGKRKAIQTINADQKLQQDLEPILAKERFAQIVMDVTYDVTGPKERKFTEVQFARALKANNLNQAYRIMEFIGKRMVEGKFTDDILDSLKFAETPVYAPLVNNRVYYKYQKDNSVDEDDLATFERLIKLDPSNPVYVYNKVFCQLKLDSNAGNPERQAQVQQIIDGLYGKLDSSYVNGLNIEWQFKIMESLDTLENADAQVDACIARIKSFYNIKDASWQNALKLSYVFSKSKDFKYAATLLEPYLTKPDVTENLVYMYVAAASRVPEKYYSRTFAYALDLAQKKNPTRYCKLFGEPYMTFQVLENPEVKKTYYSSCSEAK